MFGLALGPTDEELVRRFKNGDTGAFSTLLDRYQDRVYSLCLRWLSDAQEAEEVAQEVFVSIFRALHGFRGESKLSTWVFRVATNHCRNHRLHLQRRARNRHEPLEGTNPEAPDRQLPHPGPGTDRGAMRSEASQTLLQAIEGLEEGHRAVVLLRDVQDLSYEEISDILDLPTGTVKSRLHRARTELARRLRARLGPEDIHE